MAAMSATSNARVHGNPESAPRDPAVPGLNDRGAAGPDRVEDQDLVEAAAEGSAGQEDDGAQQDQGGGRHYP